MSERTTDVLHVELVEQAPGTLQLRLWGDDPGQVRAYPVAHAEIADLIATAETDYYGPLAVGLVKTGQRLFRWLDGGERRLSTAIEAAAYRADVLVLAIATPHGLAHLPWELLHDGTGFVVHAPNPPVLPVRWRSAGPVAHSPAYRPLQLLFMASSPENVHPVLDYEREEHGILTATRRWPLDLTVEESGCLEELGELVRDYGAGFFDVLHLCGHANHADDGTPIFLLESSEGHRLDATPLDLARTVYHRPPLVFLSGCRTGQNARHGEVRSFAEQLVAGGFRVVLGWGRPVQDADATLAAQHLYQHLSSGDSLALALARTHLLLRENGVRDWHLLRLFCAGEPPPPFVTPLRAEGRRYNIARPAESGFLDPLTRTVKVATRAGFVGRRRLLQASIRTLREPDGPAVGLLLRGQGGRGKSSVAARLCDRLRREFQRVVVFGRLDEPSLVNAWAAELLDHDARRELREPAVELRFRIEDTLHRLADTGRPAPLFVLDDFEQNQPGAADGELSLAPHAASVLAALFEALAHAGVGRVLITCRYALPPPFDVQLETREVLPLDATERQKQLLRLEQRAAGITGRTWDPDLLEEALQVSDGNPRLFEWLHSVLAQPGLDYPSILEELRQAEERFREDILARRLVASLPEETRVLLGRMLLLNEPVPLAAIRVLAPDQDDAGLRRMLERAAELSLLDITDADGEKHYRVPGQLGGGDPPLLPVPGGAEAVALASALLEVLFPRWWTGVREASESRGIELARFAVAAGRQDELVLISSRLSIAWINSHRYQETVAMLEPLLGPAGRHPEVLLGLARAKQMLGYGDESGALLREAVAGSLRLEDELYAVTLFNYIEWLRRQGEYDEVIRLGRGTLVPLYSRLGVERERAMTLGVIADVLAARGELEEALRIHREEALPVYERLGDLRGVMVTLSRISDLLMVRGELEEALRIQREKVLPLVERLGDAREWAVAVGKVADVMAARGELDEALRIHREEVIPILERVGDARERALTLNTIADILTLRDEPEEALRIWREEVLPVYERLGDVRARALILGRIADALALGGEYDEALRVRREEELPVYERLGDARSRALTMGKIAEVLVVRGELEEALRVLRDEVLPVFERMKDVRSRAAAMGQIADILMARGELDEALRIRQEEQLPVFERLGDVRERAMTLSQIADILMKRGEIDEALRIRREEQLPVFKSLRDVRLQAMTLSQIADILTARGELDEALRIRREEQLPVFERLGNVRERAVTLGQIADILTMRGEIDEALRIRREEQLPVFERLGDVRERAVTLSQIADILMMRGEIDEALRIRQDEVLPVFERLGDVRERAMTLGRIADVLVARGEMDEALRIYRMEQLPVLERLDEVRECAVVLGKIADVLAARGELEEALRIREEEELPVYTRLGDVRQLIVARAKIAVLLLKRGRTEDSPKAREYLVWGYQAACQRGYVETTPIADLLRQYGIPLPE